MALPNQPSTESPPLRVFFSRVSRELGAPTTRVAQAIDKMPGFEAVLMDSFAADSDPAELFCAAQISGADVFVLVVGHCAGAFPPESASTYTMLEYRAARDADLPIFVFMYSDGHPLSAELIESDAARQLQKDFRSQLQTDHTVRMVSSESQLLELVIRTLLEYQSKTSRTTRETRMVTSGALHARKRRNSLPAFMIAAATFSAGIFVPMKDPGRWGLSWLGTPCEVSQLPVKLEPGHIRKVHLGEGDTPTAGDTYELRKHRDIFLAYTPKQAGWLTVIRVTHSGIDVFPKIGGQQEYVDPLGPIEPYGPFLLKEGCVLFIIVAERALAGHIRMALQSATKAEKSGIENIPAVLSIVENAPVAWAQIGRINVSIRPRGR